jgi:CheY-like chemotaxis protein
MGACPLFSIRWVSETLLVVEDDSQLRAVLRELLTDAGYAVLDAECSIRNLKAPPLALRLPQDEPRRSLPLDSVSSSVPR